VSHFRDQPFKKVSHSTDKININTSCIFLQEQLWCKKYASGHHKLEALDAFTLQVSATAAFLLSALEHQLGWPAVV
jgi:hypothetical protein